MYKIVICIIFIPQVLYFLSLITFKAHVNLVKKAAHFYFPQYINVETKALTSCKMRQVTLWLSTSKSDLFLGYFFPP